MFAQPLVRSVQALDGNSIQCFEGVALNPQTVIFFQRLHELVLG
jgi:hypothetical protein